MKFLQIVHNIIKSCSIKSDTSFLNAKIEKLPPYFEEMLLLIMFCLVER